MNAFVQPASIGSAHDLFLSHFEPSPVVEVAKNDDGGGLFAKLESELQAIRAFKIRGALNALAHLSEEERSRGVITHSSGNHGAALALAAQIYDVSCDVVVPNNIRESKLENIKKFGGKIHFCGTSGRARSEMTEKLQTASKAHFVHPYADQDVITGQATAAKEFLEQQPDLDQLIVPVGGGGLLVGTLFSATYFGNRTLQVIGAEPNNAAHINDSIIANKPLCRRNNQTSADALRSRPEAITLDLLKYMNPRMKQVSEKVLNYVSTLNLLEGRTAEPSSLVALTQGLIQHTLSPQKKVGVIVTGGNV